MIGATRLRLLGVCVAIAMLPACGASFPQSGTPAHDVTAKAGSWMGAAAARWDLLYLTNDDNVVYVYRYWQRKLVGKLTDLTEPTGECVDAEGNVYITDFGAARIVEFAHGGKKPIRFIDDSPYSPYGCSVNLHNGDLAVANYGPGRSSGNGNLAVFRHGKGKPILYYDQNLSRYKSVAYDDKGDILTTDCLYTDGSGGANFAYLSRTSIQLLTIHMTGGTSYHYGFDRVHGVAWDGRHWLIVVDLNHGVLFRIVIKGDRGHPIGMTTLSSSGLLESPVWIYNNHMQREGTQVVGVFSNYQSMTDIGYWKYPAGGSTIGEIAGGLSYPRDVAVSLKQQ